MKDISKELEKITNKYVALRSKAWDEYRIICREEEEEILKLINFKYKYIKYEDVSGSPQYLYVNEQFRFKDLNERFVLILRGQGFDGMVTNYADATYLRWDQFYEIKINIENLNNELEKIKEITEEEYNNEFFKILENIKEEHMQYLKRYDHE